MSIYSLKLDKSSELLRSNVTSFKCEEDVIRLLEVPVLALVPLMISDADRRTRRRWVALIGAGAIVLAGSGAALVLWRLRL